MNGRSASAMFFRAIAFLAVTIWTPSARAQTSVDASVPRVYSASEVDTHARRIEDGAQPAYPDSLRPLGIDGKVLAQFVVDTTGMVDTTSILTEAYGQPLFAASVRHALATMHFTVAQKSGHKVAEEIEQSFVFHKEHPAPVAPVASAPMTGSSRTSAMIDSMLRSGGYKRMSGRADFAAGTSAPPYPPTLVRAGLSAIVRTQFVIDSTGRIDPATFRVLSVKTWRDGPAPYHDSTKEPDIDDVAAEQIFAEAVRDHISLMRFIPARAHGHNVSQFVTQPFTFTMLP